MTNKRNSRRIILGVGVAYALTIGLTAFPILFQPSQRLLGHSVDAWIFYWNDWWLEQAIATGRNWLFTPYLFYPQGTSLITHSNSFANSLLALPLRTLLDPVSAYNLVLLFGLWMGALGMFLLAREITRHSAASFLAGLVFAFAPYHLTHALAHGHLGSIHWWPFYALFLRRALRGRRAADALYAGIFAALTVLSGLHLPLLLAAWTAAYLGWHLLYPQKTRTHTKNKHTYLHTIGIAGLVGIIALTLSAPIILPVARNWNRMTDRVTDFDEDTTKQTDLLAYLTPPPYNLVVGPQMALVYQRFVNRRYVPYLGYTVLILSLASLLSRRKEAWFWLLGTGLWGILAAGPTLRINGILYPNIPMPYRLIEDVFPISAIRTPDRFNLLVVFSLSTAASLGAAYLAKRRRWLLVPLVLLTLIEYLYIPLPMWDLPPISPFLQQMAQEQEMYGVVDYPMGYPASKEWLYYQTVHGKPIVEGHVSRYTAKTYETITSNPLLRALYQPAARLTRLPEDTFNSDVIPVSTLGPALRALETSGIRYILLHKSYLEPDLEAHFQRVFPLIPTYEDSTLAVYDVAHPLPIYYDDFPAPLTPNADLVRFDVQPDDSCTVWQFQIMATLLAPSTSPLTCQIRLVGENGSIPDTPITLFETPPVQGENWTTGGLTLHEITISLTQTLEPGDYHWNIACPETATYTAPDTLHIYPDGHVAYTSRLTNVRYGDAIQLLGYRWRTERTDLLIHTLWEALKAPHTDYKIFVHLLDASGNVVGQYDAIPCGWKCPTSQWQTGDIIPDMGAISLQGLPPGEYHPAIGLYHAETQERLPAQGQNDELYPNSYFVLPDTFWIKQNPNP